MTARRSDPDIVIPADDPGAPFMRTPIFAPQA
jgi:hypothetical protein